MSLLSDGFDSAIARSCFSALWTPERGGAVDNLALIEWIDNNAWFQVGEFTLREWSQLRALGTSKVSDEEWIGKLFIERYIKTNTNVSNQQTGKRHTPEQMDAFIDMLEEVLGSGMRIAFLDSPSPFPCLVLAHPGVRVGDEIHYLRGCSIPVALRAAGYDRFAKSWGHRCCVIGGVYRFDPEDLRVFENLGDDVRIEYRRESVGGRNPIVVDLI
jgi:hypothetical protein